MRGVVDYNNYDDMKYAVGLITSLFACSFLFLFEFWQIFNQFLPFIVVIWFSVQIRKLDDSLFRNQFSKAYIRVHLKKLQVCFCSFVVLFHFFMVTDTTLYLGGGV